MSFWHHRCDYCNKRFVPLNVTHRWCSEKCRNAGYNKYRREVLPIMEAVSKLEAAQQLLARQEVKLLCEAIEKGHH